MTLQELKAALQGLGMPVAYGEFKTPTEPPFITYQFTLSADLQADNQNYQEISGIDIELYTRYKDPTAEALVETMLKTNRIPYQKSEIKIEAEKLIEIVYEIQLI